MLGNCSRSPVLEQIATGTITAGPYPAAAADPVGPPDKEQKLFKHCGVHAQRGRARVSAIVIHNWAFPFREAALLRGFFKLCGLLSCQPPVKKDPKVTGLL